MCTGCPSRPGNDFTARSSGARLPAEPPWHSKCGSFVQRRVPVPLRVAACGLLAALSFTSRVAVMLPIERGLKNSEIVHEPPAASVLPQLVLPPKLELLRVMLLMVTLLAVPLVSVRVCEALLVRSS